MTAELCPSGLYPVAKLRLLSQAPLIVCPIAPSLPLSALLPIFPPSPRLVLSYPLVCSSIYPPLITEAGPPLSALSIYLSSFSSWSLSYLLCRTTISLDLFPTISLPHRLTLFYVLCVECVCICVFIPVSSRLCVGGCQSYLHMVPDGNSISWCWLNWLA